MAAADGDVDKKFLPLLKGEKGECAGARECAGSGLNTVCELRGQVSPFAGFSKGDKV